MKQRIALLKILLIEINKKYNKNKSIDVYF